MKLFIKWVVCVAVMVLLAGIFPGIIITGGHLFPVVAAATVLWAVNIVLRPLLQLLSLPFTLVTFGLFSVIVNAFMVRVADLLIPGITIRGFLMCIVIAICISIVNSVAKKNCDT